MQGDRDPGESPRALAQRAGVYPFGEAVGDHLGESLGRRVHAGERGLVVEVAVVEPGQHGVQLLRGQPDVHHDVVGVEVGPPERGVHHERGPVQPLGRPEDLAPEAVGDHEVITDGHAEHRFTLRRR